VDALTLGIPVVVLPLGADQPDNADRCEELGAGISLDAVSVAPDRIADAITTVLHDPSFADAARTLATEANDQPLIQDQAELRNMLAPIARRPTNPISP
jgi:UDP:flavonoid glycosyltransferase YjiC (YdhE family)